MSAHLGAGWAQVATEVLCGNCPQKFLVVACAEPYITCARSPDCARPLLRIKAQIVWVVGLVLRGYVGYLPIPPPAPHHQTRPIFTTNPFCVGHERHPVLSRLRVVSSSGELPLRPGPAAHPAERINKSEQRQRGDYCFSHQFPIQQDPAQYPATLGCCQSRC